MVQKSVSSVPWQDYRAANTGMVIMYNLDQVSDMPIREVPEELPSEVVADPNYETGSYGLYSCTKSKMRSAFFKGKMRYLFFAAKYEGPNDELNGKFIVTGYYHVAKTADVYRYHLRYLTDTSCMAGDTCVAFRADEVHFVGLEDAYIMKKDVLVKWGQTSTVTRQTRVLLNEELTAELVAYLKSKPNQLDAYIAETKRLMPEDPNASESDDDE